MTFPIKQMAIVDYARLQALQGARIVEKGGVFWRQVRPLFFRPMVLPQELDPAHVVPPCSWPGAYQFAVAGNQVGNSTMSFLFYDELRDYTLENLSHNRRRLIKNAAKLFEVRPLSDLETLTAQGHSVYVSFFERTHYRFRSDRTQKQEFDRWAQTIFAFPSSFVLGAYDSKRLVGVSVSFWVHDTLLYATLFAESEAQRKGVGELMLHVLRTTVAQEHGIARILVRPYQGGTSHDQYYLMRGCKLVRKPALLRINPAVAMLLRSLAPAQYAKLRGTFSENGIPDANEQTDESRMRIGTQTELPK